MNNRMLILFNRFSYRYDSLRADTAGEAPVQCYRIYYDASAILQQQILPGAKAILYTLENHWQYSIY